MEFHYMIIYGEIALKKKNRHFFEKKLILNIKYKLNPICHELKIKATFGRIYVDGVTENIELVEKRLTHIFGILGITPVLKTDQNVENIKAKLIEYVKSAFSPDKSYLFKVEVNRADKRFPIISPDMERMLGGVILKNFPNFKVQIKKPPVILNVEIRDEGTAIYSNISKLKGQGGLPVGSSGKGLLLLSGGIDSPLAGWLMMKRGMEISAIYFHTPDHISPKAAEKVKMLTDKLALYSKHINLYIVNFSPIQEILYRKTNNDYLTILMRRSMMRISNILAKNIGAQVLITGENLAQVASQTVESISIIENSSGIPIFRPLLTYDKTEIIDKAKEIDTYKISILPYLDCCMLFTPKHPKTKPHLVDVEKEENRINITELEMEAATDIYEIYKGRENEQ